MPRFVPGPLNANELLQRAGFFKSSFAARFPHADTLKWQKVFAI